ncbi:MAG: UDP-N-acetylglucosamine 1-carboxyvinyltransferase, partial [Oscillospiraceae bacterium]|nr:UDP-N-acetylglucosamine 1-carboxyvinyltransferase [Oscillospiraceae bacterium]
MEKFVINGGKRLEGEVNISGAKNAAVAILPAAIIAGGPCVIENIPSISDVEVISRIVKSLGVAVSAPDEHSLIIDSRSITTCEVPHELSRSMRASYYFLGALLSRFKEAHVPLPGGCNLGARPMNQHLDAFAALGCEVSVEYGMVNVSCKNGMHGAQIFFDKVSVGSTINAILAAVRAEGQTVLENVAKEPHIVDVA